MGEIKPINRGNGSGSRKRKSPMGRPKTERAHEVERLRSESREHTRKAIDSYNDSGATQDTDHNSTVLEGYRRHSAISDAKRDSASALRKKRN